MSPKSFWIYLAILAGSTYLIRAIPFAAVQKKIENRFIRSFLYYIPYAVLTVMTIPAVFYVTGSIITAAVGFVVAVLVACKWKNLTLVAVCSCVSVFLCDLIIGLF